MYSTGTGSLLIAVEASRIKPFVSCLMIESDAVDHRIPVAVQVREWLCRGDNADRLLWLYERYSLKKTEVFGADCQTSVLECGEQRLGRLLRKTSPRSALSLAVETKETAMQTLDYRFTFTSPARSGRMVWYVLAS